MDARSWSASLSRERKPMTRSLRALSDSGGTARVRVVSLKAGEPTPGGVVAIAVQPRNSGATDEIARRTGDEIAHALTVAGFRDVQLAFRKMKPVSTACAIAKA
jgi:hypothetical protein